MDKLEKEIAELLIKYAPGTLHEFDAEDRIGPLRLGHIFTMRAYIKQITEQRAKLAEGLERIEKMPDLPNPDRDADWKNCMKSASYIARETLASIKE